MRPKVSLEFKNGGVKIASNRLIRSGSIKDKITYYTSNGNVYPNLIKQLKEASSVEEQVQVFLSYSK